MTYIGYMKWRLSLLVQKESASPLTIEEVEETVMSAIEATMENEQDPIQIIEESDLKVTWSAEGPFPRKVTNEKEKRMLKDWIMSTDQMKEVLGMFLHVSKPQNEVEIWKVQMEEPQDLTRLIEGIILVEGDWQ